MDRRLRFTGSSRKHKIGKAHALFVIENNEPIRRPGFLPREWKLTWIGVDDRDLELEVIGIEFENEVLVIHVMPTEFRKRGRDEY